MKTVIFTAQDPLSIDELGLENLIDFYPNPVSNNLNINLSNLNEDVNFELFNTLGQKISAGSLEASTINTLSMSQQLSGIYFITLSTSSGSITRKIVKK